MCYETIVAEEVGFESYISKSLILLYFINNTLIYWVPIWVPFNVFIFLICLPKSLVLIINFWLVA